MFDILKQTPDDNAVTYHCKNCYHILGWDREKLTPYKPKFDACGCDRWHAEKINKNYDIDFTLRGAL